MRSTDPADYGLKPIVHRGGEAVLTRQPLQARALFRTISALSRYSAADPRLPFWRVLPDRRLPLAPLRSALTRPRRRAQRTCEPHRRCHARAARCPWREDRATIRSDDCGRTLKPAPVGGIAWRAAGSGDTASTVFASAKISPSMLTRPMAIMWSPCIPTGKITSNVRSAICGTAHEPGAMAWPSDRAAAGGNPRMRMKLSFGARPRADLNQNCTREAGSA